MSQGWFELHPAGAAATATVRAAGDIDLTNAGQFQSVLDEAVSAAGAVTADLTAVTYCDSAAIRVLFSTARRVPLTIQVAAGGAVTGTLLQISGLDQIATVVTLGA